jgi:hypothetical protein
MSHDGLPVRAAIGARAAASDRRSRRRTIAGLTIGLTTALALVACNNPGASTAPTLAPASETPASAAPSTEASVEPSASASTQALLSFQEANASKIFGGGIITDLGDGSSAVTLGVVAIGFADPMPAEIVAGDCGTIVAAPPPSVAPSPSAAASAEASAPAASEAPSAAASAGPSVAPTPATLPVKLTDVAAGSSNTVVQITLADLLAAPSAVVMHKSAADATVTACADVTSSPLPVPSALPSLPALPSDLPSLPTSSASTTP